LHWLRESKRRQKANSVGKWDLISAKDSSTGGPPAPDVLGRIDLLRAEQRALTYSFSTVLSAHYQLRNGPLRLRFHATLSSMFADRHLEFLRIDFHGIPDSPENIYVRID
jgi:hypothetical protein